MKHFAKNILKVRVPKKNKIKFVKINFYDVSVIFSETKFPPGSRFNSSKMNMRYGSLLLRVRIRMRKPVDETRIQLCAPYRLVFCFHHSGRFIKNCRILYSTLCTGGAYYVTYIFRFISNKSWDGGGGEGGFT